MAQLRSKNELYRVRDVSDGNSTSNSGGGLKVWNGQNDPKQPIEPGPETKIAGPGAAIKTPARVDLNNGVNVSGGVHNLDAKNEEGPSGHVQPNMAVKGTGKEESRIDKPYGTLDKALKDGCTDM